MSTNKNELLDQYERCLDLQFFALTVPSREQLPVITAIEENRSGVPEIKEQFEVSSNLQQLKLEKRRRAKFSATQSTDIILYTTPASIPLRPHSHVSQS